MACSSARVASLTSLHRPAAQFNDRGWDHEDNLGKGKHIEFGNVGQNTVELWTLESGGGWVHPIHVHLVVSCLNKSSRHRPGASRSLHAAVCRHWLSVAMSLEFLWQEAFAACIW
jgi:hypothetical protein